MRSLQLYVAALTVLLPVLTTQTYNNNLFDYPTSLAALNTNAHGVTQYQYPNGTPINEGASASLDPFENILLAPGYTVNLIGDTPLTYYVPVLWTTAIFETFYRKIFERAAGEMWGHYRPSKRVVISIGQLQISFTTTAGPIPWHIIAAFAWNMWQAAKRGFAAGYALRINSPTGASTSVFLLASNHPVAHDNVEQEYLDPGPSPDPDPDTDDCDCTMTEFSELTTNDDVDDYIDDICKRQCRRPERARRSRRFHELWRVRKI